MNKYNFTTEMVDYQGHPFLKRQVLCLRSSPYFWARSRVYNASGLKSLMPKVAIWLKYTTNQPICDCRICGRLAQVPLSYFNNLILIFFS